ncbi:MAG: hypothetical protein PHT07_10675 [Paludibacter sp.]|nr:hypothetical protein [Paludibacter sp.]
MKKTYFFSFMIFLFFQGCATVYNTDTHLKASVHENKQLAYSDLDMSRHFHDAEMAADETFKDLDHYMEDQLHKSSSMTSANRFQNIVNQYKRSKE